jgi:hypothetical protein
VLNHNCVDPARDVQSLLSDRTQAAAHAWQVGSGRRDQSKLCNLKGFAAYIFMSHQI